jgi:mannose-6-phosphate isomerase-like protein (cupin superfamily)
MIIRALRMPLRFDVAPMYAEIAALGTACWHTHFNTGYHDGGWSGMAMRAYDGDAATLYNDPAAAAPAIDTPLLARCPAIAAALSALECPIRSVRLLRLAPGAVIREHRDAGLRYEEGEARLHIPIATNAAVEFVLDGDHHVMEAGECWYVNVDLPHRVNNRGTTERIHLVIDCVVDEWLRDQSAASGRAAFAAFRSAVLDDVELQARLREVDSPDDFIARCGELASPRGYHFDAEDVRTAMRSGRTTWLQRKMVKLA